MTGISPYTSDNTRFRVQGLVHGAFSEACMAREIAGVEDESESESRTTSPEVEAFFNLVEREARRLRLLAGEKDGSERRIFPGTSVNRVAWQPEFKMEDFSFPLKSPTPISTAYSGNSVAVTMKDGDDGGGGGVGGKEKSLLNNMGLKRLRNSTLEETHSSSSSPLRSEETGKRKKPKVDDDASTKLGYRDSLS